MARRLQICYFFKMLNMRHDFILKVTGFLVFYFSNISPVARAKLPMHMYLSYMARIYIYKKQSIVPAFRLLPHNSSRPAIVLSYDYLSVNFRSLPHAFLFFRFNVYIPHSCKKGKTDDEQRDEAEHTIT